MIPRTTCILSSRTHLAWDGNVSSAEFQLYRTLSEKRELHAQLNRRTSNNPLHYIIDKNIICTSKKGMNLLCYYVSLLLLCHIIL